MSKDQAQPCSCDSHPTRKGAIRKQNQDAILKAAEQVFAENGYAGTSMSDIARRVGLPKANLHYYFGTKESLYRAVLDDILSSWRQGMDAFHPESSPQQAISAYIRAKLSFSRFRPAGSKVFANEIIQGAGMLGDGLDDVVEKGIDGKDAVIDDWAARGLIAPVDGRHFFIMMWALTQHYADFNVQVRKVLRRNELTDQDWQEIFSQVETFVMRGLNLID